MTHPLSNSLLTAQPRHKASREGVEIFMAFWVIFCGRFAHFFTRTKGKWLATSILFPFYSLFLFSYVLCVVSLMLLSLTPYLFFSHSFFGRVKACVQIFNFFLALQIPKRTFTPKVNLSYEVRDWISNVTPLAETRYRCLNVKTLQFLLQDQNILWILNFHTRFAFLAN